MKDRRTKEELLSDYLRLASEREKNRKELENAQQAVAAAERREAEATRRANAAETRETKLLREKDDRYGTDWSAARTREHEYAMEASKQASRAAAFRAALIVSIGKDKTDEVDADASFVR